MPVQTPASASSTALSMISQRQCMRPALVGRADVHAGALAHGLETLEDLQVACGVVTVAGGMGRAADAKTFLFRAVPLRTAPSGTSSVTSGARCLSGGSLRL